MISEKAMAAAKNAYDIEAECINEMKNYFEDDAFSKAVELLAQAERIGTSGCGHAPPVSSPLQKLYTEQRVFYKRET